MVGVEERIENLLRQDRKGFIEEIVKYTGLIQDNPEDLSLYCERGGLYQLLDEYDSAIDDFETVLRLSYETMKVADCVSIEFIGCYAESVKSLAEIFIETEHHVEAINYLGVLNGFLEHFVDNFNTMIILETAGDFDIIKSEISDLRSEVYCVLAKAYEQTGQIERAKDAYTFAIGLAPELRLSLLCFANFYKRFEDLAGELAVRYKIVALDNKTSDCPSLEGDRIRELCLKLQSS